jgi:predicted transcriptional regulator
MELNAKGNINRDTTTGHLNRLYTFEGIAWYKKSFAIPSLGKISD